MLDVTKPDTQDELPLIIGSIPKYEDASPIVKALGEDGPVEL